MSTFVPIEYKFYRLEDARLDRYGCHPTIIREYKSENILKVGDMLFDIRTYNPYPPFIVTYVGQDNEGKYAQIKEAPFIELLKRNNHYKHISKATFPLHDEIEDILFSEQRMVGSEPDFFLKDLVFLTRQGFIFSYYDIMNSEDLNAQEWSFKMYLNAIITATEIYLHCWNTRKAIEYIKKLLIPSQIQVGEHCQSYRFHINLNPGSGYYWE